MKITVIGLGYLGTTHAVVMAELGHDVIGIDPDINRVEQLRAGTVPFFEPELDDALTAALKRGTLRFETEHPAESTEADLHFLCVGTPERAGTHAANTDYLFAAIDALAPVVHDGAVVVGKSTVPVGTAALLQARLAEQLAAAGSSATARIAWNPEFLREGTAVLDSRQPDRIVAGVDDELSEQRLREVYEPLIAAGSPFVVLDIPTAELVKVAANAFLATKISFINAVAEVAEKSGANASALAGALGYDERIGNKFLKNGLGFGGGCLPKDIHAFMARADELGAPSIVELLGAVDDINARRRARVIELATASLAGIASPRVTILGASFKPDTDDIRQSPALDLALDAKALGWDVVVHDPIALDSVRRIHPQLTCIDDVTEAVAGSDLVVLATEWPQYRALSAADLVGLVRRPAVIDARNVLDGDAYRAAGWSFASLGTHAG